LSDESVHPGQTGSSQFPLVSILVPSYNHDPYVIDCLESIKHLSYQRLELIVSDDCSNDQTFEVAQEWVQRNSNRFERCLVVRQNKNVGLLSNLQYLFDDAHGVYLAYIASDDVFIESAISERVNIMEQDPDVDAVFGNAQAISVDGTLLQEEYIPRRIQRELASRKLMVVSLLLQFRLPGPVMMLRKNAVLEGGSLGKLPLDLHSEDIYIFTRLASLGKLRYSGSVVAKYRIAVPGGMNWTYSSRHLEQFIKSYEKNRHLLTGFNRFVLNCRTARYKAELANGKGFFSMVRLIALRSVLLLMRTVVFAAALFNPLAARQEHCK